MSTVNTITVTNGSPSAIVLDPEHLHIDWFHSPAREDIRKAFGEISPGQTRSVRIEAYASHASTVEMSFHMPNHGARAVTYKLTQDNSTKFECTKNNLDTPTVTFTGGHTVFCKLGGSAEAFTPEHKLETIQRHAPRIWLAKNEEYFPCSIDWSFQFLERYLNGDGKHWLRTKQTLESPSDDSLPLFKGNLADAAIYAFWVPKACGYFDICYFTYYGYNRGKQIADTIWGNHVGDWEHLTLRLDDHLQPIAFYMSEHDGGATHTWNDLPKIDTHGIAYAAWGSHALYAAEGGYTYKDLGPLGSLTDRCSQGTAWDSWNRVAAYDYHEKSSLSGGSWPSWMSDDYAMPGPHPSDPASGPIFRWGNTKAGCFAGQCRLENGPTGPIDKGECWNPVMFG